MSRIQVTCESRPVLYGSTGHTTTVLYAYQHTRPQQQPSHPPPRLPRCASLLPHKSSTAHAQPGRAASNTPRQPANRTGPRPPGLAVAPGSLPHSLAHSLTAPPSPLPSAAEETGSTSQGASDGTASARGHTIPYCIVVRRGARAARCGSSVLSCCSDSAHLHIQ